MIEPLLAELAAASSVGLWVGLAAWPSSDSPALDWMRKRGLVPGDGPKRGGVIRRVLAQAHLGLTVVREGTGRPPRFRSPEFELGVWAALGALTAAAIAALTGQLGAAFLAAVAGALCGPAGVILRLRWLAAARRARMGLELAPTLELLALELASGAAPLTALAAVAGRSRGELSGELRRLLIAAQIPGGGTFEARLTELADRQRLPALASLAAALGASREYGASCQDAVRVLAQGVRRAQREELIARGRRALNRVLIPAAVGVLLPFLGLLLFPALAGISRAI